MRRCSRRKDSAKPSRGQLRAVLENLSGLGLLVIDGNADLDPSDRPGPAYMRTRGTEMRRD